MASSFVSGSQLSRGFYRDVVRPLLTGVPHSAALLGWGSDVLGFMGMNQMGDVLKAYAKLMGESLQSGGATVALRRD